MDLDINLSNLAFMKKIKDKNTPTGNDWLTLAAEMSHIGYWKYDVSSKEISWSHQAYKIHGVAKKNFSPNKDNITKLYHPDDHKIISNNFDTVLFLPIFLENFPLNEIL